MGVSSKPYPISGGKISTVDSALHVVEQGLDARAIDQVVALLPEGIKEFPVADQKDRSRP